MVETFTMISVDDGLVKTSTNCNAPILSSTVYDDSLKYTATTTM